MNAACQNFAAIRKSSRCGLLFLALLLLLTACKANSTNALTLKDTKAKQDVETRREEGIEQKRSEQEGTRMKIQIGDATFTAVLADNSSVDAWKELLKAGPLTLNMSDYGNMEKGADLGVTLPQNNEAMDTQAGDIILYQGRTLVIYYAANSWSLTPIGKIIDADAKTLKAALGAGTVAVTWSLESYR